MKRTPRARAAARIAEASPLRRRVEDAEPEHELIIRFVGVDGTVHRTKRVVLRTDPAAPRSP
jgi:hypothetical protein